ncbi:MAG TPA: sugar-binding protein, partial [bacterium]|nr:sugar-binding protein [bacterium]
MKWLLFVLLAACFARGEVYQADIRQGPIKVDGRLEENDWKTAHLYEGFSCLQSRGGGRPRAETKFSLLQDGRAIYIGVRCEEPYMNKLRDGFLPRDSSFWERDTVEIFIDPEGRGLNYYQFAVTAGNSQYDAYWIEGGNTQGGYYSSLWESAVYRGENFWSLEVKIPLYCFYYTDCSAFSDTYRLNIARNRFPEPELSSWAVLDRGFHEVRNFRKVQNMPVKSPFENISVTGIQAEVKNEQLIGDLLVRIEAGKKAGGEVEVNVSEGTKELGGKRVVLKEGENAVRLEGVRFEEKGKKELGVLVVRNKEVVLGSLQPVEVDYDKIKLEIEKPFYRCSIYPGQTVENIAGRIFLNLPDEEIRSVRTKVSLTGEGFSRELELKGSKEATFKITAGDLKEGDYRLSVKVAGKQGEVAVKEVSIKKLARPEKGSFVYLDENLNLVVNGQPLFVRGWYGNSTYLVSQAIRNKYGNKPNSQYVNAWECWMGVEPERLHQVSAEELKTLGLSKAELEKIVREEYVRVKQDVRPHPVVFQYLQTRINRARENPDVWFYYLCDEPECRTISPVYLKYLYEYLREHDPYHPVMVITRSPALYTGCADILNPHPYLNPRVDDSGQRKMGSLRKIKDAMREIYANGQNRLAAWCTPQAFTYRFIDRFADYPTFDEFNSMVWTAVVNGAKGFTPFIYNDHLNCLDLRLGVDFIYQTLAELEDFLLSHPDEKVKCKCDNQDVDILVRRRGDKILMIAVNMTDKEQIAVVSAPELKGLQNLYGFREKTLAEVKNGTVKLRFHPYQV